MGDHGWGVSTVCSDYGWVVLTITVSWYSKFYNFVDILVCGYLGWIKGGTRVVTVFMPWNMYSQLSTHCHGYKIRTWFYALG